MIVYQLVCENGHEFESWFQSSTAFDEQCEAGVVECPHCSSNSVSKGIMSPNVSTSGAIAPRRSKSGKKAVKAQMSNMAAQIREHVENNFDYVGTGFPEEARKIHYGEAEERGIYGEASADETEALLDEGVDILPMPVTTKRQTN